MADRHPRTSSRPACDLCHSRKVKCDREETCKNCRLVNAECRRTRPHRLLRTRVSRFDALKKRLEKLENNTQPNPVSPVNDRGRSPTDLAEVLPQSNPVNQHIIHPDTPSIPSLVDTPNESSHRTAEARGLIQRELDNNDGIAKDRQNVLRSALDFVAGFTHAPPASQPDLYDLDLEKDLILRSPSPEMLYMMIPSIINAQGNSPSSFHWPDHITDSTLESMLLRLIENESIDPIGLQYRVCVYSKAFFLSMHSPQSQNNQAVKQRVTQSQNEYKRIALASLSRLSFLTPPSLSLVQALLSGAMLMQYLGNMFYSWNLTAFASRTLMSLNLHVVESIHDLDAEARGSLYWCYYLDRVLSSLFVREPSLPKLRIDPASMVPVDPSNPFQSTVKMMLEMAKIQERVLEMQLNQEIVTEISQFDTIVVSADSLLGLIKETRSCMPLELHPDFDAAEFGHAAILTNAFKCSQWSSSYQQRCLESARKALILLAAMLDRRDQHPDTTDNYPSFITWTILLYPLTPYFVLFCNVVASSHKSDYDLMYHVTESISRVAHFNEWIHKVYGLFHHFLLLCDPLVGDAVTVNRQSSDLDSFAANDVSAAHLNNEEESLIWELFNFQPSLDWVDIPILDDAPPSLAS